MYKKPFAKLYMFQENSVEYTVHSLTVSKVTSTVQLTGKAVLPAFGFGL